VGGTHAEIFKRSTSLKLCVNIGLELQLFKIIYDRLQHPTA